MERRDERTVLKVKKRNVMASAKWEQVSRSAQLNFVVEHWVATPILVTLSVM